MKRHPLLVLGVAAALGAASVQSLDVQHRALILAGVASLCVCVARACSEAGRFRAAAAIALAAGAAAGWLQHPADVFAHARTARTACTVLDSGTQENGASTYLCALDRGPTIQVTSSGGMPKAGTHLLLRGRIESFDEPRNPGEPDQREIERERGVAGYMGNGHVMRALAPESWTPRIALARAHEWALHQLRLRLPEPAASILAGELWGERATLPPELRNEFQETGTVHVLVTAGLHLGVIAALVLWGLRACTIARIPACLVAITIVWSYVFFSGAHLPALRAATMISLALSAYACGAASRSWNAYGGALLAVTLFDPLAVTGASFALSFSCVGAILLTAETIETALQGIAGLPHRAREALTLTLATQIGTWPLTAAIFTIFAPYACAANLAVVPIVGATMLLGILQLVLAPVPALAQAAANINDWLLTWMIDAVRVVAGLPGAVVAVTPPPLWAIVAYDLAIVAAVRCWKASARTATLALLGFGIAVVAATPHFPDDRLRINVLDVGQADAIVVQTPLGHTILVDAGGRLERGGNGGNESTAERIGERVVVPFLRRSGLRILDAIILSHPHGDHVGGMAPVMRSLHAVEFADGGQRYGGYAYNDALNVAHAEHVPIVYPRAGAVWKTDDGITLRFLGPSLPLITGSQNDINNNSIAFILQYKSFRMLFTGDAGAEAEQRFLSEGIDLHADVLKVGHHGSAYSSTPAFIAAVHPKYAIISVGRHNMFGHPAPSTIATLQRFGAQVYRTDENGAVTVNTDGIAETVAAMLHI